MSTDALVAAVWPDQPPASARRNIHLYVHRLRGVIGEDVLRSRPAGYQLTIGDELDATRFRRLAAEGLKGATSASRL
jgi:DNA-binding SARP family transcriptional activator